MRNAILAIMVLMAFHPALAADQAETKGKEAVANQYVVGVDDVLDINVLQPEKITTTATVAPDGSITFPYIGSVLVKGMTLEKIQDKIQTGLADGYMKYPVVQVGLRETHSRNFFVYGEVNKPGTYPLGDRTTVLEAISIAGGFTKYGSSSRVKVLHKRTDSAGYETMKININAIMNGSSSSDMVLGPGDIVVVSEGVF